MSYQIITKDGVHSYIRKETHSTTCEFAVAPAVLCMKRRWGRGGEEGRMGVTMQCETERVVGGFCSFASDYTGDPERAMTEAVLRSADEEGVKR